MPHMKTVLTVGLKGGVGKTTTAVGLAQCLKSAGLAVGLLDLDYRTPNVPLAMDGGQARLDHTFQGDVLVPPEIDGIRVMSMAYIWPPEKSVLVSDEAAMEDVRHLMSPGIVDWGGVEYLVCDTPPTSTGVVEVALNDNSVVGAVIVTQAARFALMDTMRTFDLFRETGVKVFGLVVNQAGMHDLSFADVLDAVKPFNLPLVADVPHVPGGPPPDLFGTMAEMVIDGQPVTIEPEIMEEDLWHKFIEMARALK